MIETFDLKELGRSSGGDDESTNNNNIVVLDVAGGKGKLSIELSLQARVRCCIVDPLVRKHGKVLDPRDAKRLRKINAPHPKLLPTEFNTTTFVRDYGGGSDR